MSLEIEEEAERETGPCRTGLWARVRNWLEIWLAVFPPHEILRDGLSRRFALRCCNWLWPLEATVRRLIIAAALAFDPAGLASAAPGKTKRKPPGRPSSAAPGPACFRVVSIRGAGAPRDRAVIARAPCPAGRHLPFPADDLLRLGASCRRHDRKAALRHLHPLHRRGRIRPLDPDYIPESETDYANSSELLFGAAADRESPPVRVARSDVRYRIPAQADDSEWRRIDREWERVLPAPGIAARITALVRVLDTPDEQVRRLARRLAAKPDLAALLRGAPPPLPRKPAHDHFPPQVDEDLPMLAYAALHPPDTS